MSHPPRDDDANPFAPPDAPIGARASEVDVEADDQAELIRRHHLRHEASVKSVGLLCYLAAGFCGFVVLLFPVMSLGGNPNRPRDFNGPWQVQALMVAFVSAFYGVVGIISFGLGFGLRRLQVWSRWATMALSVVLVLLCLVFFVVAVTVSGQPLVILPGALVELILGYVFYLMVAPKGGMVFSAEYARVIARTPSIRTRTSLILKILLAILAAFFGLGAAVALIQSLSK